jgi:hypothetical protein
MHFGQAFQLARPGLCRFSTHSFADTRLWPLMLGRRRERQLSNFVRAADQTPDAPTRGGLLMAYWLL